MGDGGDSATLVPRLCHIVRWPDFNGYGFNLHAEKGKAGQFIGKVDEGSPAEAAGLKQGDRIVEVNGTNIGNENHQQVVSRVKAGGDETRLLVVDAETDQVYKEEKKIVRGDLPEVCFLTAERDDKKIGPGDAVEFGDELFSENSMEAQEEEPAAVITSVSNGAPTNDNDSPVAAAAAAPELECSLYPPRLCHLCKWPDFDGYGFNLHADKDKPGQYIGSVDPDSPAETGGLKENDRIIEVNGENIESQTHTVVIQKIKSGGDRTSLLVVDKAADEYYKDRGMTISSSIPSTMVFTTPPRRGEADISYTTTEVSTVLVTSQEPEFDRSYTEHSYQFEDEVAEDSTAPFPEPNRSLSEDEGEADISYTTTEVSTVLVTSQEPEFDHSYTEHSYEFEDEVAEDSTPPIPEPNVSLSDNEEAEETVTAAVSETVESYPPPEPEAVANGSEEEEEKERERMEEAEAAVAAQLVPQATDDEAVVAEAFHSAVTVDDDDDGQVVVAAPAPEQQEVQEEGFSGGMDVNAYEEVDVTATVVTTTSTAYETDFAATKTGASGPRRPPSVVKVTCVKVKADGEDSDDDIFTMVKEPPGGFRSYSDRLEARVSAATAVAAGPPSVVIETDCRVAGGEKQDEDTPKEEEDEKKMEPEEEEQQKPEVQVEEKTEKEEDAKDAVGFVAAVAAAAAADLATKEEEAAKEGEDEDAMQAAILADYETVPPPQKPAEDDEKQEAEGAEEKEAPIEAEQVATVESAPASDKITPEPEVNGLAAAAAAAAVAQVNGGGGEPVYDEVTAAAEPEPEPKPEPKQELPSNGASNGINGGAVDYEPAPEPTPEPTPVVVPEEPKEPERTPEPQAAVIRSTVTTTPIETDADPILKMSAAEMKERLRSRKKQDPRLQKTSFTDKHKMFERM